MKKSIIAITLITTMIIPAFFTKASTDSVNSPESVVILTTNHIDDDVVDSFIDEFSDVNNVVEYNIQYKLAEDVKDENSIFALSVDMMNKSDIKDLIRELYNEDKKIYMYGKLKISDYADAIGIDEFYAYIDSEENSRVRAILDDNVIDNDKYSNLNEDFDTFNIIGYSKDEIATLVSINDLSEISEEMLIANIINQENMLQTEYKPKGVVSLKSSTSKAYNYCYNRDGKLMGKVGCIWTLYRDTADKDSYFDYFAIKPIVWTTAYNNYRAGATEVKVLIPELTDMAYDYAPSTTKYGDWTVGLDLISGGINLSGSMPFGSSIKSNMNWDTDIAKWTASNGGTISPSLSWKSKASKRNAKCVIFFNSNFCRQYGAELVNSGTKMLTISVKYN